MISFNKIGLEKLSKKIFGQSICAKMTQYKENKNEYKKYKLYKLIKCVNNSVSPLRGISSFLYKNGKNEKIQTHWNICYPNLYYTHTISLFQFSKRLM